MKKRWEKDIFTNNINKDEEMYVNIGNIESIDRENINKESIDIKNIEQENYKIDNKEKIK